MSLRTIRKVQQLKRLREECRKLQAARKARRTTRSTEPSRFTTESLLTGVFRLTTATPAQRAVCRIIDGLPLRELAAHPHVLELLGCDGAIPPDVAAGRFWREVFFVSAERSAKSLIVSSTAIKATQTIDASALPPGDIPRVSILSVRKDLAGKVLQNLRGAFQTPELKPLLQSEPTADTILVRGKGGRVIEIKVVAGAVAGSTLVSRWAAGVIFDEATRMNGPESKINLADSRTAIAGRMLPGAQAFYIGSPWAPYGDVFDAVEDHWGKPNKRTVVLRGTGPMLNPQHWTPELLDELQQSDPRSYQINALAQFVDAEHGLFDVDLLAALTRQAPPELPYDPRATYSAGVDPSGGSVNANGFALVIVQRDYDEAGRARYRVAYANEWRNDRPKNIWEQVALQCKRYGLAEAHTDQFAAEANADLAALFGLTLEVEANTTQSNVDGFTNLQTLAKEGQIELPPHMGKDSPGGMMRRDLLNVSSKVTQTGIRIELAKTSDGRHCDYAPALVKALQGALDSTNPLIEAMRERIRRRANGTA